MGACSKYINIICSNIGIVKNIYNVTYKSNQLYRTLPDTADLILLHLYYFLTAAPVSVRIHGKTSVQPAIAVVNLKAVDSIGYFLLHRKAESIADRDSIIFFWLILSQTEARTCSAIAFDNYPEAVGTCFTQLASRCFREIYIHNYNLPLHIIYLYPVGVHFYYKIIPCFYQ